MIGNVNRHEEIYNSEDDMILSIDIVCVHFMYSLVNHKKI
jgi:hypothetical protein